MTSTLLDARQVREPSRMPSSPAVARLLQAPGTARGTDADGLELASNDSVRIVRALSPALVNEALALRHQVFVEELGARPSPASGGGLERDIFDPFCEHLVAIEKKTGRVVATCRLLLPEKAAELGCLYCDGEFWLTRLNPVREQIVEVGRTCVAPGHRNGLTIRLLWVALANFVAATGQRYAIGAASVGLDDGGELAMRLYQHLSHHCMADEPWRTWPRRRLPMIDHVFDPNTLLQMPALIKSYVRMGARLMGEPHYDEDFGCADFPVLVDMWLMDRRLLDRVHA